MQLRTAALSLATLLFFAPSVQAAQPQDAQATRMRAALSAPDRPADNKARDESRKPIETVQFFGIKEGDVVVDMIAARGWFTEVLSAAIGPRGRVYMQNPPFIKESDAEKALIKRLGNVEALRVSFAEAGVVGKADAAVVALNLHDIYNGMGDQPAGEPAAVEFLKDIHSALKPGGVIGVIDHVGVAGQDNKKLHRMLPQQARDALTKAGFTVEAESKLLANSADDPTKAVSEGSNKGQTDQFMIRARKPR
jgi:predicted methyltransferase